MPRAAAAGAAASHQRDRGARAGQGQGRGDEREDGWSEWFELARSDVVDGVMVADPKFNLTFMVPIEIDMDSELRLDVYNTNPHARCVVIPISTSEQTLARLRARWELNES